MRPKPSPMFCQVLLGSVLLGSGLACSGDANQDTGETETETGTDDEVGTTGDETTGDETGDGSTTDTSSTDTTGDGDGDDDPTDTTETDGDGDGDPLGADYGQPGPYAVGTSPGSMQVDPQCNLQYVTYEPDTLLSDTAVLLAHGFMRSIDDMAPTAEHIASWGVRVHAVSLCTNNFQIDHQHNGEAIALLGQALEPAGPIYAGFSAGGLAAWIAAVNDPVAIGYVGLDAVDSNGLAGMFAGIDVPIRGVVAEPGQCNTNNNFLSIYEQKPGMPVIRVVDAQHFDFETDACGVGDIGCGFCAPNGPDTRAVALGLVTAAILIETGADFGGETWWAPGGSWFDMLAQQGEIQLIQ